MRYSNAKSRSGSVHETSPRYYEWRVEGRPLSIQLSLAVIERLETDIMKGFWAVPKRGMEVGGVLVGRIETGDNTVVVIDDYEPVSCEHRRGPSYVLSEPDRKRLEKVLRRGGGKQVVGFYRSHTRLGLYLDQDDMAVIDSYFANPSQVFLLVRPDATKPGMAGFFFREEEGLHRQSTYLEFPFNRAEILKQNGATVEEPEKPAAAPPPAPPARPVRARPAPPCLTGSLPVRIPRLRWKPAGAIAAGLIAFATLGYQVLTHVRPPAVVVADFAPSLSIEPSGSYLQVSWNRNAAGGTQGRTRNPVDYRRCVSERPGPGRAPAPHRRRGLRAERKRSELPARAAGRTENGNRVAPLRIRAQRPGAGRRSAPAA